MRASWVDTDWAVWEVQLRATARLMRDAAQEAHLLVDGTSRRLRAWAARLERRADQLAERARKAKLRQEPVDGD